jgi:hypothetical protein
MTVEKENFVPRTRLPNDPENGHLSKAEFVAKMRRQKEIDAKMRAYEAQARAEVYGEFKDVKVEAPEIKEVKEAEEVKEAKPKMGRPKKDK